ncbi:putative intracellular protease/amidase [Actinoplanes lutulentus]|nr:DJ-1/PfpI family protein [Actinoplanes lutulentus]MBB2940663.1 putative intracellular protease/amidase [Actinoplanes lutulentus]
MRIRRTLAVLFAGLATATAVGVVHAADAVDAVYPAPHPFPLAPPGAAVTDPRPTVAVLLGPAGANAADVLAPFETLAVSGRYRVVTVAESRDPVPLTGGLDLVPDHTFADVGDVDWIVVPEVQEAGSPRLRPAVDWLRQRHAGGARILGVCAGTALLARTGLLADRPATSSWLALYGLERQYPDVRWTRGVRYVDDGRIITTAAVLSGVDGALRIIERDHGVDAARQAAAAVRWPGYHPGGPTSIDAAHPVPADAIALLNVGFRDPVRAGVLLTPGVGEIELASVFRTYTQLSYVARLTSVTADGQPIRSRHGLTFVPRTAVTGGYDRLLVPGQDAARTHAVDVAWKPVYVHSRAGFPFDGTLRDLAATTDAPTARWVAKTLEYRADDVTGPAVPWSPLLLMVLAMAAGGILYAMARAALARLPRLRNWLRHLAEMLVAMVAGMTLLGLFVLLSPWIGGAALSATGHVLMLVAMVALILVRWEHYAAAPAWAFRSRRGGAVPPSAEPDFGTNRYVEEVSRQGTSSGTTRT